MARFIATILLVIATTTHAQKISNVKALTADTSLYGNSLRPLFGPDGKTLVLSGYGGAYGTECGQVYRLDFDATLTRVTSARRLSTGIGYNAVGALLPDNRRLIYSGTFHKTKINITAAAQNNCPVPQCRSSAAQTDAKLKSLCANTPVVWDLYQDLDLFLVNEFANVVAQLTNSNTLSSEADISPDGKTVIYTTQAGADREPGLWTVSIDGTGQKKLIDALGYEGDAAYSPDGTKVTFHASRPNSTADVQQYKDLLFYNLVDPRGLNIFVANADGSNVRQVTNLTKGAAFAPEFAPDSKTVLFASNFEASDDDINHFRGFKLYAALENGTIQPISINAGSLQIKESSFPGFSSDGKKIAWSATVSTQAGDVTQVFIGDWSLGVATRDEETDVVDNEQKPQGNWLVDSPSQADFDGVVHFNGETHLTNVRQLTFGGENAEGYFSFDDTHLTLQATGTPNPYGTDCDQIYQLDLTVDPRQQTPRRLSTGLGVCTCSYFFKEKGNHRILYAGTYPSVVGRTTNVTQTCPGKKCQSADAKTDPILRQLCNTSYTWDIYPDFDIFIVNEYGNVLQQLTNTPGYDAEGVVSPDGSLIAFTSMRGGDLDLWIMNSDGTNPRQVTNVLGYDGGSFFSPDGKRLIFRASRPNTTDEIKKYKDLLSYNLVAPTAMELFVVNIDGTNLRQITHLGGANWAPYYLPDNKRVIFSSDFNSTAGFGAFDLWVINDDGTGLEQVTHDNGNFDSFPMFSYSGKQLVWGSSRNGSSQYDLNLFIADWVDKKKAAARIGSGVFVFFVALLAVLH